MSTQTRPFRSGACRTTATAFGVLAGLGGITHGVGEVLQGNVPVKGVWLESWTTGPIAEHMGGEPGITVLPTALSAGLVTLTLAGSVVMWSLVGLPRRRGGPVLVLLSFGMLLSGGGIGPPVIGMLAGAVGRWGVDRHPGWVRRLPGRVRRVLARAWPGLFAVALANAVFLVVGSVVLAYSTDLHMPDLFEASFFLTVVALLVLLLAAPAYDAEHRDGAAADGTPAPAPRLQTPESRARR